ncbi:DUF1653 domain-containing protein [Cronobacter malonaticus]|uniref:DUF1653 domain-containing protein n=1 Tax=Cronobacter malonaticus TaxID=413503 RepID=UPI000CFCFE54|nr:DUF1653 domain-containing protein [Cronobacter malonaticus]
MKPYMPEVGQRALMLLGNAIKPAWKPCRILAISTFGYAIETEDEEFGATPRWFDMLGKGAHISFRPFYDFSIDWRHLKSGEHYQMIAIANQTATKEGFEPTVVYKKMSTGEVFSRSAETFYQKFEPFPMNGVVVEAQSLGYAKSGTAH